MLRFTSRPLAAARVGGLLSSTSPLLCVMCSTVAQQQAQKQKMSVDTRKLIQLLRARTDAPIVDCKKALTECGAEDIDKCVEWLKKKGVATADKKANNETNFGVISAAISPDNKGAFVFQLCSETDFASRNEKFLTMAAEITGDARTHIDQNAWEPLQSPEAFSAHFNPKITELIRQVGENVTVRRAVALPLPEGVTAENAEIGVYAHGSTDVSQTSGSLVAITFLEKTGSSEMNTRELANDMAQSCVAGYFNTDTPVDQQPLMGYTGGGDASIGEAAKQQGMRLRRVYMQSANDEPRDVVFKV